MNRKGDERLYDVISVGIIVLIAIFSFIRFNYLPQFIDGYYHLSCANAFIKSGGWVGIDWWGFAPYGRPHLYPPFYHLLLSLMVSFGVGGMNSLRIAEVTIVPLFFLCLWYVFRKNISSIFSLLFLVTTSSFFSFYSSVSGNIPASFAIIFGVLSWHYLKKDKIISSALFLILAFYTHAGIPWVFVISFMILAIFYKEYRKLSLGVVLISIVFALPFIIHEARYMHYVNFTILREVRFSHYSIFILTVGMTAAVYFFKKKNFFTILFLGYTIGAALVFFKYPYRFFSAQGMLGLSMLAAYLLYEAQKHIDSNKGWIVFSSVIACFFFIHPTVDLNNGKLETHVLNSTYYNIASGKFIKMLEFNSLFYPQYYLPLAKVIENHSDNLDIVTSNLKPTAQIFSAITNRATSYSIFGEVKGFKKVSRYNAAKVVVWMRPDYKELAYLVKMRNLEKIYENNIALVFINPYCYSKAKPVKAKVTFNIVILCIVFFLFIFIVDNAKILTGLKREFKSKLLRRKNG